MKQLTKVLSLVVPCFNEEKNVSLFFEVVMDVFKSMKEEIEIIFVNDGSTDNTYDEIKKIKKNNKKIDIKAVDFSRNFGKEAAILAGLREATGEYTALIDADLQQHPKYVMEMMEFLKQNKDYDEVACYQKKRKESFIMKVLKAGFYSGIKKMTEIEIPAAASDFRCFRSTVREAVISLQEKSRFSKGLFAWVGYNTYLMPYTVEERKNGKSKWNIRKLFKYAFGGITDYSTSPLLWPFKSGIMISLVSFITFIILLILRLAKNKVADLWILLVFILMLFGILLINLGVLGSYVAKNTVEIKNRPVYVIKEKISKESIDSKDEL